MCNKTIKLKNCMPSNQCGTSKELEEKCGL